MVSSFPVRSAASTICCASALVTAIGFSHMTCLPASSAATVISAWEAFQVHTWITSIEGSCSSRW